MWNSNQFDTLEAVGYHLERQNLDAYWTADNIDKRIAYFRVKLGFNTQIESVLSKFKLDPKKPKYNTADIEHIHYYMLKLLELNMTKQDIIDLTCEHIQRGSSAVCRYYDDMIDRLSDVTLRKTNKYRYKRIKGLERDMDTAFQEYRSSKLSRDRNKWFNTYLAIKARIDSYFPNGLQFEPSALDADDQVINVNFEVTTPRPKLVGGSSE